MLIALLLAGAGATICGCTTYEDPEVAGKRLYSEGNYASAAGAYRTALRITPQSYEDHYYLGVCYDYQHAYQEAIQSYRTALDVMKLSYEGRDNVAFRFKVLDALASAIAKSGTRDAELDSIEAKARASQKPEDYLLVAKVARYGGDADLALEQYDHAALLDSKNYWILKEYGLYLEKLNQTVKARQILWQAAANDPTNDKELAAALRRVGVVPGPSLKDRDDLTTPALPVGPIPPPGELARDLGLGGNAKPASPAAGTPTPAASLQAPRD
jgi:tetratricopeptide (TPR) repeat protein